MKIHYLNCGTLHPISRRLVNGEGGFLEKATLVCNCLLVEQGDSWILIDAGLGIDDLREPEQRLGKGFIRNTNPKLDFSESAISRVKDLGIDPQKIKKIVLTHIDVDHVGGISDFPWAEIVVSKHQFDLAQKASSSAVNRRLHPQQWNHDPVWSPQTFDSTWNGRPATYVSENILLVDLPGHLEGHCGVVVKREGKMPLIHAGDAVMSTRAVQGKRTPLGLAIFEMLMRTDRYDWSKSRVWLKQRAAEGCEIICAHEKVPTPERI